MLQIQENVETPNFRLNLDPFEGPNSRKKNSQKSGFVSH